MGYANGGPVRGSGTGTSDEVQDAVPEGTYIMPTDSTRAIGEQNLAVMGGGKKVPVNLSNGEFKLPPEQVHAIGVQALDRMKDATHTPVAARGFAPGARQQAEPPLFFADGGVVDEENARRFVRVPEAIGHQPGRQQPTATATPAAPQGMSDAQRAAAISQIPTGGVASPARPAPVAPVPAVASTQAAGQPLDAQAASDRAKIGAAWDTVKDVTTAQAAPLQTWPPWFRAASLALMTVRWCAPCAPQVSMPAT